MGSSSDDRRRGSALPRLYLITDRHAVRGGDLTAAVAAALAGGVRLVQLREKDLPLAELRSLALELRAITARHGARLLLNAGDSHDRIELAREIGADGVHLTSTTAVAASEVCRVLGDDAIVGVSTHSLTEVERAVSSGTTLVTFGPVFATPSKKGLGEPTGVELLARATTVARPAMLYALGGVDPERIDAVLAQGVHGVAVIRAVLAAADAAGSARRILEQIDGSGRAQKP